MANENDVKLAKVILNRVFKLLVLLGGLALLICSAVIKDLDESAKITMTTIGASMITVVAGLDTAKEVKEVNDVRTNMKRK